MNMKERQSEGRVEDERIKKELRLKEIFLIVIYQKKSQLNFYSSWDIFL